jgi:hypothetical protein
MQFLHGQGILKGPLHGRFWKGLQRRVAAQGRRIRQPLGWFCTTPDKAECLVWRGFQESVRHCFATLDMGQTAARTQ